MTLTFKLFHRGPFFSMLVGLVGFMTLFPLEAVPALKVWPDSLVDYELPQALGEIIYRKNADSLFQVFIVANSHRSPLTGGNGRHTVQAQIETFRIGEWLIQQKQIDLLFPEGFFGNQEIPRAAPTALFDKKDLEERLADTSSFVNAEMLLHENYGIPLRQVEDRMLYSRVKKFLCDGLENGAAFLPSFGGQLEYWQNRRSATILQSLPGLIEAELRGGRIAAPRAMLTIGLSHLDEILTFLDAGEIRILAPPNHENAGSIFSSRLELFKKRVGVTVIVPRVLMKTMLRPGNEKI